MGILQVRILEWVAMPSSRGSSQPRDRTQVSSIAVGFFTVWVTREAGIMCLLREDTNISNEVHITKKMFYLNLIKSLDFPTVNL